MKGARYRTRVVLLAWGHSLDRRRIEPLEGLHGAVPDVRAPVNLPRVDQRLLNLAIDPPPVSLLGFLHPTMYSSHIRRSVVKTAFALDHLLRHFVQSLVKARGPCQGSTRGNEADPVAGRAIPSCHDKPFVSVV